MDLVLAALSAFTVTELIKSAVRHGGVAMAPLLKQLITLAVLGVMLQDATVLPALAIAFFVHTVYSAGRAWVDTQRTEVIRRVRGRI